jgi:hypothetical protein
MVWNQSISPRELQLTMMVVVGRIAHILLGIWALLPSATYRSNLALAVCVLRDSLMAIFRVHRATPMVASFAYIPLFLFAGGLFSPLDFSYTKFLRPWSMEKQPKQLIFKTRNTIGTVFCGFMLALYILSLVNSGLVASKWKWREFLVPTPFMGNPMFGLFILIPLIIWTLFPCSCSEVNLVLGVLILKGSHYWVFMFFRAWSCPMLLLDILYAVAMLLPLDRYRPVLQYFQPFTVEKQAVLPTHKVSDN